MRPEIFDMSGRVAIVTGAAGGFGTALTRGFLAFGASVVAADINKEGLERLAQELESSSGKLLTVPCDLGSEAEIVSLVETAVERFDKINILINNAGANPVREHPDVFALSNWEHTVQISLTGCFLCSREVGRQMRRQGTGGAIVNVASTAATTSLGRGNMAHGVSKAGVLQLTRELAIEWAADGIRVNAIQPSQFATQGWESMQADPEKKAWVDRVLQGVPLKRFGVAEEIVGPVIFLASDAASMITGATLPVDGGNLAFNATGTLEW